MANLKGAWARQQRRDMVFRLNKLGISRVGCSDHGSHSFAIRDKRKTLFNTYVDFLENQGIMEGKINLHLSDSDLFYDFLELKLVGKDRVAAKKYISAWSSFGKALDEANITMSDTFFETVEHYRDLAKKKPKHEARKNRSIPVEVVEKLYEKRYESGVLAEVQRVLGFRTSEAYELLKNPNLYISNNSINGIKGKGNHIYICKTIPDEFIAKIMNVNKLPYLATYRKDLKKAAQNEESIPHDFRYTFAKKTYEKCIDQGMREDEALAYVSTQLNHHRPDITKYYIEHA